MYQELADMACNRITAAITREFLGERPVKALLDPYWVSPVNRLRSFGRWDFAEFTEVCQIEADFEAKIESEFQNMIDAVAGEGATVQPER